MKSARERAQEALELFHPSEDPMEARTEIERMFVEHARDQRSIIAEHVKAVAGEPNTVATARAAVLRAPAPGETR